MERPLLKNYRQNAYFLFSFGVVFFVSLTLLLAISSSSAQTAAQNQTTPVLEGTEKVNTLDKEIKKKQELIEELSEQIKTYEDKIQKKRREANTLVNEIALIENQIAKTQLDIKSTKEKIQYAQLNIDKIQEEIAEKEELIQFYKEQLAELIRTINDLNRENILITLVLKDRFSEIFDHIKYIENLNSDLKQALEEVVEVKNELNQKQEDLEIEKKQAVELQNALLEKELSLQEKVNYQESLLLDTRASEGRYQNLLEQGREEEARIDNELRALEKEFRSQLEELENREKLDALSSELDWPVSPSRGITAYFHDPDYPFRYIFEHPAVDIRAYQGTPVKAAASGYVAKVKNGGYGYSYIMLIHGDGISTVYGHVSKISVEEDTYVTRGQVIALSGGMPGTLGAGRLTTGPHLHFEVRLNGIPVDPLEYLP